MASGVSWRFILAAACRGQRVRIERLPFRRPTKVFGDEPITLHLSRASPANVPGTETSPTPMGCDRIAGKPKSSGAGTSGFAARGIPNFAGHLHGAPGIRSRLPRSLGLWRCACEDGQAIEHNAKLDRISTGGNRTSSISVTRPRSGKR